MTRESVSLFGIASIAEYLRFCTGAVEDFNGDQASVLRGFSAILALNHIPDWLQYKLSSDERRSLNQSYCNHGKAVTESFEALNSDLRLVRQIANGFKHLRPVHSTERISGYGAGPYGVGPYGSPYLLIDLGEDVSAESRYEVGYDLCRRVLEWWQQQLKEIVSETENVGAPA
jgi:hypothetical protein